jgi:hypothetical protein
MRVQYEHHSRTDTRLPSKKAQDIHGHSKTTHIYMLKMMRMVTCVSLPLYRALLINEMNTLET